MKMKNARSKPKKILLGLVIAICTGVLVFNAVILIGWLIDRNNIIQETSYTDDTAQMTDIDGGDPFNPSNDPDYWYYMGLSLIDVNITELKKINPDTVGFISVAGTNINYPVVQTGDNDYYLTHSFKRAYNGAGWVFMDYRNDPNFTDQNTVIYGHSRFDGTMFSTLKNILGTSWVNNRDNYVVRYVTESESMLFRVFAVYVVPAESYYIQTGFSGDSSYQQWLDTMIGRSHYDFGTTINTGDRILTLSTCQDTNNDNRVVMHAKLIKKMQRL